MSKRIGSYTGRMAAAAAMALGVIGVSLPAHADTIFYNGAVDFVTAFPSDDFPSVGDFEAADDFTLDLGAELTDIKWAGTYGEFANGTAPAEDSFTIRIYADNNLDRPDENDFASLVLGTVERKSTGMTDQGGFTVYKYRVGVDGVLLDADTRYWLSIVNDAAADGGDPWAWATSAVTGGDLVFTQDGGAWQTSSNTEFDVAFRLGGAPIPEPSAALVFGIGVLVVGSATRRGTRR